MSPMVPVNFIAPSISYRLPRASQLSSTSQSPYFSQKSFTAFRLKGFPRVWATITARVLSDRAASSMSTSMLYWGMVTSTNTGTAPYWMMGVTVVGNPAATVITSSPFLTRLSPRRGEVRAMKARRLAEDPELTREQYRTPRYSPSFRSNSSVYRPAVSQNSRALSTRFTISCSS